MNKLMTMLLGLAILSPLNASVVTWAELNFREPPTTVTGTGGGVLTVSHTTARGSAAWWDGNAAAGTVKAYAHSIDWAIGLTPGPDSNWARGYVSDDFILGGLPYLTPVNITATFTLDGVLSGSGAAAETLNAFNNAGVVAQFTVSNGLGGDSAEFKKWARTEEQMGDCWQFGCAGFQIPITWTTSFDLQVWAGQPFNVYYYLQALGGWAYGGSGGTSDLGSTGKISFVVPQGITLTSEGGFGQQASSVPEPSSLALFCGGLALAAALRRRIPRSE